MCGFCTAFLEKKLCSEGGITNVQTSHSSREQMSANFTLFLGARIFVFRSNPYIFRFHRICVGIAIFSLFRTETNLFLDPNSLAATVTEERGRGRSLSLSLRSPFSAAANRRPNRFLSNWAGGGDVHFVGSGEMRTAEMGEILRGHREEFRAKGDLSAALTNCIFEFRQAPKIE